LEEVTGAVAVEMVWEETDLVGEDAAGEMGSKEDRVREEMGSAGGDRGTLSPGESLRLMSSNQCMRLSRSCQLARSHISPRCCICSCMQGW